jgi:hypothetical protein
MKGGVLRIGSGAGYSGDRIDPAVDLAERGALDYLVFECLAERTIAIAVGARSRDPTLGYDPLLEERMRAVLPAARRNCVRIISNMGAANPIAAARRTAEIAGELGLGELRIAAVIGDEVLPAVQAGAAELPAEIDAATPLISANAYLGCEPIVEALRAGADIVLTGRAADPSLFLAPMVHEFGWALDDWARLGAGTVIGHLLECAGQITGGYFADPGFKDVAGLATLGFPLAEVAADGSACVTKLPGTGGQVTLATCKEQLLYELHDPARYLTPDVTADFSAVRLEQTSPDRVRISGGRGATRPERLKVSVGYQDGYLGEGQISYAGSGAEARGRLALAIVEQRLQRLRPDLRDLRLELIGVDAVSSHVHEGAGEPREVRARAAARTSTLQAAQIVGREVEALYTNGPAGGGGAFRFARPIVAIGSTFIDRDQARPQIHWETAP